MSKCMIEEVLNQSCQQDRGEGVFEAETARMLELNLDGSIWTEMRAMVAFRRDARFNRLGIIDRGVVNLLKKAVSGEGVHLPKAEGQVRYVLSMQEKHTLSYDCRGSRFLSMAVI